MRKFTRLNHRVLLLGGILLAFLLVWAELAVGLFGMPPSPSYFVLRTSSFAPLHPPSVVQPPCREGICAGEGGDSPQGDVYVHDFRRTKEGRVLFSFGLRQSSFVLRNSPGATQRKGSQKERKSILLLGTSLIRPPYFVTLF
jgi:hypothetical protein